MNEVNKSFVVNRHNYLKRQINLSKMVEDGHPHAAKAAPFESHIAKAMGIFIDRKEIHTRDLTAEDKLQRKEELLTKMRKMKKVNNLIKKPNISFICREAAEKEFSLDQAISSYNKLYEMIIK